MQTLWWDQGQADLLYMLTSPSQVYPVSFHEVCKCRCPNYCKSNVTVHPQSVLKVPKLKPWCVISQFSIHSFSSADYVHYVNKDLFFIFSPHALELWHSFIRRFIFHSACRVLWCNVCSHSSVSCYFIQSAPRLLGSISLQFLWFSSVVCSLCGTISC